MKHKKKKPVITKADWKQIHRTEKAKPSTTDVAEHINAHGTFEVQNTADTDNVFPLIAQGLPKKKPK